jgi:hypothetical protein
MLTRIFDVRSTPTSVTVRYFRAGEMKPRERTMTHSIHSAMRFMIWLRTQPVRTYWASGVMTYCPALSWETAKHYEMIDGEWRDADAEQAKDDQPAPTPTAPDPLDRKVDDITVADQDLVLTCRTSADPRPMLHLLKLSDPRADGLMRMFSDHLFGFSVSRQCVTFKAHDTIPCPFCCGTHDQ